ncbi:hypothetical protein JCM9279_002901 [Rhodotorula babjevae]
MPRRGPAAPRTPTNPPAPSGPSHNTAPAPRPPQAPPPSVAVTLRLLSSFYTDVQPLEALVPAESALVRDSDSDKFRQLVADTLVATTAIVDQVQQRLFSAHAKHYQREKQAGRVAFATPKNVLALGYRLHTSDPKRGLQRTRSGLGASYVSVFPNTVVSALVSSLEWDLLASRIGADSLIELLSSPSIAIFMPLANACFLQVSGTPVAELKPHDPFSKDAASSKRKARTAHERTKRKRWRKGTAASSPDEPDEADADSDMRIADIVLVPPSPTESASASPAAASPSRPTSPTSRTRPHGPSLSAPLLGTATFLDGQSPAPAAPTQLFDSQLSPTKRVRPSQSICSTFGGGSEAGERPTKRRKLATLYSANAIVFSRHRMYHNRVASGKGGKPPYGLPLKHVLTRLSTLFPPTAPSSTRPPNGVAQAPARHLAKYLFPRQFGLHNVFTSEKARTSFEIMPDYLDREVEIKKLGSIKTPERLKPVVPLLDKLATLSSRCNYRKLLNRRCPSKLPRPRSSSSQGDRSIGLELAEPPHTQVSRGDVSIDISHASLVIPHGQTQAQEKARDKPKLAEFACSFHEVERFVHGAVAEVIPRAFWGSVENARLVEDRISAFIRMRRFESTTVHALLQGFSLTACAWLGGNSQRSTAADMDKRKELLGEFLFWLFDGFVIDLVRTNFYVTDAATHQNRPLYFRQDDWNKICAPLLAQLGSSVFEQVPPEQLLPLQRARELGFSYVRLLPKETGVRPIVNLARRPIKLGLNGQKEVGQPINKILQSVFDVLTFEKKRKPYLVGSLVSDPHQIYAKLRSFKLRMLDKHNGVMPKLYLVKVDVRAAYDTIQQDKLLEIVENVLTETLYWIQKYSQVSPAAVRPMKAFKRAACTDSEYGAFTELAQKLATELHNVVLSDQVLYQNVERDRLMQLLREHITTNLVKVSGRLYRQKTGIPQGSVLSSLLCSLFYGNMERTSLSFTHDANSTLLRYVDDFLFISTEQERAGRFLRVMDDGIPEYGCAISAEKRLTNFDIALKDGEVVPPLKDGDDFPWCGLAINPATLEVRFNTSLTMDKDIHGQLTIQRCRTPGQAFVNSMFRAVKIRSHVLYTDTSHNSLATAYSNVYRAMLVVALKFRAYVHEWGIEPRRKVAFLFRVVQQVIKFEWAASVNQSRSRKARQLGVEFSLKRPWVTWLSYHAFRRVLSRQPAAYAPLLDLVAKELRAPALGGARRHLGKVVSSEKNGFADGAERARRP